MRDELLNDITQQMEIDYGRVKNITQTKWRQFTNSIHNMSTMSVWRFNQRR